MKKKVSIILLVVLTFMVTGCSNAKIADIPKGYIREYEYYDEDDSGAYNDYAKYVYPSKDMVLNNNECVLISENEIENIKGYFLKIANRLNSDNRLGEFDFDYDIIDNNDYVRIETKEGEKISNGEYGKYDDYSVYFFDTDTLTLYYIHSNVQ